ncbi:SPFH domain-containing protein [Streptomyces sp. NEAU-PBA10]|uniref:SPFH domain-containing protein n=1 Tax=Streptomyces TaxID=1883 RepID=UPI000647524C|nr:MULTISPECIES: SPFH domain-containing protein [unclassified Streptomyces]MCQ9708205.1 SPFH domain-containing protein [Streptomyces sp. BSP1]
MGTTSSDTGRDHADLAAPVARAGLPEPASPAPAERPASPEAAQSAGPPAPEPGSATGSATGSAPAAAPAPAADGTEGSGPPRRSVRIIRNADTMEIPVHLLFREDADGGEGARDAGASADPFAPRPEPEAGFRAMAVPHRGAAGAHRTGTATPRSPLLCPPALDESVPAEHLAPSLPGSLAVAVAAGGVAGAGGALWWGGLLPAVAWLPPAGAGSGGAVAWVLAAGAGAVTAVSLGGLARGRTGWAWVRGRFGRYRGTVRRTGLVWLNPLVGRCRMDLRLRHWRSEPLPAVDADGVAVEVVLHVVWRVADTARAAHAVDDVARYLGECAEAALARVVSRRPVDAFRPGVPTLRHTEAVAEELTGLVAGAAAVAGLEVFAVQPVRIAYAPEVAEAMGRRRLAALDALHRDALLAEAVDAVEETVRRLTARGLVELDEYEHRALVRDLTVAFCAGRTAGG